MTAPTPKFHVSSASPDLVDRAHVLYAAYVDNAHNLNYQGLQCPPWDGLGESVQSHWCAVAAVSTEEARRLRDELRRQRAIARCKFRVISIQPAWTGSTAMQVKLGTHYDPSVPEDVAFTRYTPSGQFDAVIDNDNVIAKMSVGQFFYVDLVAIADDPDEGGQRK